MGEGGVGKSCLIKRYCEGKVLPSLGHWHTSNLNIPPPSSTGRVAFTAAFLFCLHITQFVTRYICTIGVDFGVKPCTVDGLRVKVNFWDLSGPSRAHCGKAATQLIPPSYRAACSRVSHLQLDEEQGFLTYQL